MTALLLTSHLLSYTFDQGQKNPRLRKNHNGLHAVCVGCVCAQSPSVISIADYDTPPVGCGTMGVAITAGVLASLDTRSPLHGLVSGQPKWESHTPGTSTPTNLADVDPTLPSRFIACVRREESARRLREKFRAVVGGEAIQVTVGQNALAVQQSDVVLLWYVPRHDTRTPRRYRPTHPYPPPLFLSCVQLQTTGGSPPSERGGNQRGVRGKAAHQHPFRRHHRATHQLGFPEHNGDSCDAQRSMSRAFSHHRSFHGELCVLYRFAKA